MVPYTLPSRNEHFVGTDDVGPVCSINEVHIHIPFQFQHPPEGVNSGTNKYEMFSRTSKYLFLHKYSREDPYYAIFHL
jgi:hypothetical protein